MKNLQKEVDMGFTRKHFPAGSHMCLIYSDEKERQNIIGKFLNSGVIGKEKVSYFVDSITPDEVIKWLINTGITPPSLEEISLLPATKIYCPDGTFVPETMLNNLRTFYDNAKKGNYQNARVSGEMTWALRGIPGSDRLMEYESMINDVLVTHPVTAVCQYDVTRFSGTSILNVLKVHPMMVVKGQIVQNPYYMKTDDFIKEFSAAR
ncbi:MAG: MEDS domain-containing protein [Candidatus Riflebacteria bacterium]|nr:MEDS domain-containing protein [Candidatus Riflebacteria bacterium]